MDVLCAAGTIAFGIICIFLLLTVLFEPDERAKAIDRLLCGKHFYVKDYVKTCAFVLCMATPVIGLEYYETYPSDSGSEIIYVDNIQGVPLSAKFPVRKEWDNPTAPYAIMGETTYFLIVGSYEVEISKP